MSSTVIVRDQQITKYNSGSSIFARFVGNVFLEIEKTRFRLSKGFANVYGSEIKKTPSSRKVSRPLSRISLASLQVDRGVLSTHLSSVNPVSPAPNKSPNVSHSNITLFNTSLKDLPTLCILRISSFLEGRDVVSFVGSCKLVRNAILTCDDSDNNNKVEQNLRFSIRKFEVTTREIRVMFNEETNCVDVRVLRMRRSVRHEELDICTYTLSDALPNLKLICFKGPLTFGNRVNFLDFRYIISELYNEGRLIPTGFTFMGGNSGNRTFGVDLRCFTESEFVTYISQFYPHLKTVHLQTSRHFRMSSYPPRLLSFVSLLTEFGYVYERPALKYRIEDLRKLIEYWRHDQLAHSCILYIRRPIAIMEKYNELHADRVIMKLNKVYQLVFKHAILRKVQLVFIFH